MFNKKNSNFSGKENMANNFGNSKGILSCYVYDQWPLSIHWPMESQKTRNYSAKIRDIGEL